MEKNKDKSAIIIGASLVALVAVFTFARPYLKRTPKEPEKIVVEADNTKYSFISASDLVKRMRDSKNLIVVDTRYPEQFSEEHILGSINASNETIASYFELLEKTEEIFLLSADANDVKLKLTAEALQDGGIENFSILSGGMKAWIEAGGRTIRVGNPDSLSDQAKISIVKPEDLKAALDSKDPSLFILDLRSTNQYASEHLPQAQNIPAKELEEKYDSIPLGKNIVFYAESELEAFRFGVTLFDLGFSRSSALEGGIEAWKSKGFPLEK